MEAHVVRLRRVHNRAVAVCDALMQDRHVNASRISAVAQGLKELRVAQPLVRLRGDAGL